MEAKEVNAIDWDRYRSGGSGGRMFGKWAKQVLWVLGARSELPMLSYLCPLAPNARTASVISLHLPASYSSLLLNRRPSLSHSPRKNSSSVESSLVWATFKSPVHTKPLCSDDERGGVEVEEEYEDEAAEEEEEEEEEEEAAVAAVATEAVEAVEVDDATAVPSMPSPGPSMACFRAAKKAIISSSHCRRIATRSCDHPLFGEYVLSTSRVAKEAYWMRPSGWCSFRLTPPPPLILLLLLLLRLLLLPPPPLPPPKNPPPPLSPPPVPPPVPLPALLLPPAVPAPAAPVAPAAPAATAAPAAIAAAAPHPALAAAREFTTVGLPMRLWTNISVPAALPLARDQNAW